MSETNWHQAIVEQAAEAVVFADREGMIRIWNRGAERPFGYSAAEALGAGRVLRTRSVHKNGGKLYVDLSFGVIRGPDGAVAGAFAIGRDGPAS